MVQSNSEEVEVNLNGNNSDTLIQYHESSTSNNEDYFSADEEFAVQSEDEDTINGSSDSNDLTVISNTSESNDVELITDPQVNLRRSNRSNLGVLPKRYVNLIQNVEPSTYKQAIECNEKEKWVEAMNEEMKSLENNKTWKVVPLPEGRKAIGCKWIYKIKRGSDGEILKYKARLVAQGFSQKYGVDYDEVFCSCRQTVYIENVSNNCWF
ncbi:uncharacterized mitochondrial protein AtMg00820-like [Lucilia sericata]|uniref:uncharacterized mitochondrial protein AtMg00820-like n=1 Tax=Lucilia sericata TaxID=13632 RepID=UPI0018A7FDA1|nr:uncharacterized mitochondrial protein AtMg00820-like [Lucilia sericata]